MKRIFTETIYYYQKREGLGSVTGNNYHLPLLMEVARQYSPLMYDCLYYVDALRKNYDKDLMRQTLQGMRRNAMNILVFFDQNKRSIAPAKYYNLTPNVDRRSSLFDLLEIDEDAQVFIDFLADFFLHCKAVVDALFPEALALLTSASSCALFSEQVVNGKNGKLFNDCITRIHR